MKNVLQPVGGGVGISGHGTGGADCVRLADPSKRPAGAAKNALHAQIRDGDNSAEAAGQVELDRAGEEGHRGLNTILIQTSFKL